MIGFIAAGGHPPLISVIWCCFTPLQSRAISNK